MFGIDRKGVLTKKEELTNLEERLSNEIFDEKCELKSLIADLDKRVTFLEGLQIERYKNNFKEKK